MNPKLSEFIEKNPDLTLMGLGWAVYWRITIVIWALCFFLFFLIGLAGISGSN